MKLDAIKLMNFSELFHERFVILYENQINLVDNLIYLSQHLKC